MTLVSHPCRNRFVFYNFSKLDLITFILIYTYPDIHTFTCSCIFFYVNSTLVNVRQSLRSLISHRCIYLFSMQLLHASGDVETDRYHLVLQVFRHFRVCLEPVCQSAEVTQLKQQDGTCRIRYTFENISNGCEDICPSIFSNKMYARPTKQA